MKCLRNAIAWAWSRTKMCLLHIYIESAKVDVRRYLTQLSLCVKLSNRNLESRCRINQINCGNRMRVLKRLRKIEICIFHNLTLCLQSAVCCSWVQLHNKKSRTATHSTRLERVVSCFFQSSVKFAMRIKLQSRSSLALQSQLYSRRLSKKNIWYQMCVKFRMIQFLLHSSSSKKY